MPFANRVLFLADGGIYEEGAPSEIFDTPKREKAIAFIQKIKYFTYEIREKSISCTREGDKNRIRIEL